MLLAALIDAGASEERIARGLSALAPGEIELEVSRTNRQGIAARQVKVLASGTGEHRTWTEIRGMLEAASLPERARRRALDTFGRLAEAEARVHGTSVEEVRFHEVGALDAIADVCGVALALEELAVDRVVSSAVPAPRGFVEGAHGRLPLPPPATLELLEGAPIYGVELDVELVTPTGAALLASLAERFGPLPPMRLEATGYGAGSRDIPQVPNVVRVLVGEAVEIGAAAASTVSLIETNLDDLSPELVPDAAEACFAAGALDVWATPVQMKKGRPGIVLSALARPADERRVAEAVLRETSTIGVRIAQLRRWELERDEWTVEIAGEQVRVKVGRLDGEPVNVAPEHDDCAAVAARTGQTVKSVWAAAFATVQAQVRDGELGRTG